MAHLLPGKVGDVGQSAVDNRLFINRTGEPAVIWITRPDAPWRDLPERFGPWKRSGVWSVYQRFRRWAKNDAWKKVFNALQEPDFDWLMIDSTVVRAYQHAAGQKKRSRQRVFRAVSGWMDRGTGAMQKSTPLLMRQAISCGCSERGSTGRH